MYGMSINKLTTILPTILLLALILSIASGYCLSFPSQLRTVTVLGNDLNLDPICFIKSYNPEQPELQRPIASDTPDYRSTLVSGTASSYPYDLASPSSEIPDFS
jgi:hypothetical protein